MEMTFDYLHLTKQINPSIIIRNDMLQYYTDIRESNINDEAV